MRHEWCSARRAAVGRGPEAAAWAPGEWLDSFCFPRRLSKSRAVTLECFGPSFSLFFVFLLLTSSNLQISGSALLRSRPWPSELIFSSLSTYRPSWPRDYAAAPGRCHRGGRFEKARSLSRASSSASSASSAPSRWQLRALPLLLPRQRRRPRPAAITPRPPLHRPSTRPPDGPRPACARSTSPCPPRRRSRTRSTSARACRCPTESRWG